MTTIKFGREHTDYHGSGFTPQAEQEWDDLRFIHEGCWGQVPPSFPGGR
jgi:hypothetical protein